MPKILIADQQTSIVIYTCLGIFMILIAPLGLVRLLKNPDVALEKVKKTLEYRAIAIISSIFLNVGLFFMGIFLLSEVNTQPDHNYLIGGIAVLFVALGMLFNGIRGLKTTEIYTPKVWTNSPTDAKYYIGTKAIIVSWFLIITGIAITLISVGMIILQLQRYINI